MSDNVRALWKIMPCSGLRLWLLKPVCSPNFFVGWGLWSKCWFGRVVPTVASASGYSPAKVWWRDVSEWRGHRHLLLAAQRWKPGARPYMATAWEMVGRWFSLCPVRHGKPIPEVLVKAMCVIGWHYGWYSWTGATLLSFYGAGRLGEVLRCRRNDLLLPSQHKTSCGFYVFEAKLHLRAIYKRSLLSMCWPRSALMCARLYSAVLPLSLFWLLRVSAPGHCNDKRDALVALVLSHLDGSTRSGWLCTPFTVSFHYCLCFTSCHFPSSWSWLWKLVVRNDLSDLNGKDGKRLRPKSCF